MSKQTLQPNDYFFSGGVETSFMFIGTATIYAGWSVNAPALMITKNGFVRLYVGKEGAEQAKNTWMAMDPDVLDEEFIKWNDKWERIEPELYQLAINNSFDWRQAWTRIEELNKEFWKDSYKVEATDPFAEDLERDILQGLERAGIDGSHLHELITPSEPTRTQMSDIDLRRVVSNEITVEEYVRKYWYRNGTWMGGDVLTADDVQDMIKKNGSEVNEWEKRKQLHDDVDQKLDEDTKKLLHLLRTLTLWREERKSYVQQTSCCLQRIVEDASKKLRVESKVLFWSWPDEIDQVVAQPNIAEERAEASILIVDGKSGARNIVTGDEAQRLMVPFVNAEEVKEIRGNIASRGNAKGKIRIVLGKKDFDSFMEGEILVTTMTRPEFMPLMRRAAAIVTDEGGLTSHAAIISRELRKPCIVGTKNATQVLKTGDEVEVNAESGIITKIT